MYSKSTKNGALRPSGTASTGNRNRWAGRVAVLAFAFALTACANTGNFADPQAIWAKNGSEQFNRIEIQAAPAGPTAGSIDVSSAQLRSTLSQLRFRDRDGEVQPIFTDKALDKIAEPLANGLGELQPGQSLVFAVTQKRTDQIIAVFMDPKLTTGRVFVTDEGLNIIFGRIDMAYADNFRELGIAPALKPGQRDEPPTEAWTVLAQPSFADYAQRGRDDWIVIDPKAMVMAAPAPEAQTTGGGNRAAEVAQPGNLYYEESRERLQAIKKLRADGLISEQEYQKLRSRILNNLSGSQ